MRYTGPKARKCRRQGMNLFGSDKYDKILQRRPSAPGKVPKEKGKGGRGKLSEYGRQLLEKQKACLMFGVHDKRLRAIYSEASRTLGQTDRMMRILLERRLDNVLYRAGFATTRIQARQFVSHGLFTVNGVRVTIPSYQVKPGDKIAVRENKKSSPVFAPIIEAHQRYTPPGWLKADPSKMSAEVIQLPAEDSHFDQSVDMRKVIGFYSR